MPKITINQALRRASRVKGIIASATGALPSTVRYKEGEEPVHKFEEVLATLKQYKAELIHLTAGIAEANAKAEVDWMGKKLSLCFVLRMLSETKSDIQYWTSFAGSVPIYYSLAQKEEWEETVEKTKIEREKDKDGRSQMLRIPYEVKEKHHCKLTIAKQEMLIAVFTKKFDELNALVETANHTNFVMMPDPPKEEEKPAE